jgi:transposase
LLPWRSALPFILDTFVVNKHAPIRGFNGLPTLVAGVADQIACRSAQHFSAWIGLAPEQHSSGGKDKLGSISKQGDPYLRSLFAAGARRRPLCQDPLHQKSPLARCAAGPAADQGRHVRAANKIARMAWAMMAKAER